MLTCTGKFNTLGWIFTVFEHHETHLKCPITHKFLSCIARNRITETLVQKDSNLVGSLSRRSWKSPKCATIWAAMVIMCYSISMTIWFVAGIMDTNGIEHGWPWLYGQPCFSSPCGECHYIGFSAKHHRLCQAPYGPHACGWFSRFLSHAWWKE